MIENLDSRSKLAKRTIAFTHTRKMVGVFEECKSTKALLGFKIVSSRLNDRLTRRDGQMFIRCKNIMAVNRAHRRKLNDGRCAGSDACADDAGRQLLQEQNEREEQTVSTNNSPENTVGQWIGGWVNETTP